VLTDRGALFVSAGFYFLVVTVLGALWRAAAHANHGQVAGYSASALTWYICTSEAAVVSLKLRMIDDIAEDILSGAIATELLRPVSALSIRIASELGTVIPKLAVCVVSGGLLARLAGGPAPDGAALILAAPALLLAVIIDLLGQHAFAAIAFWVRDARSAWFLYHKLVFVLGGMLLPLEILPGPLAAIAKSLPFMAMAYAPARLAAGHFEPWLIFVQLAWALALGVAAVWVFAAGERRLQAVGG
jgi:ABC-2 type transport system permease protein